MISNHFRFFWKAFVDNQHYKKKLLFQILSVKETNYWSY